MAYDLCREIEQYPGNEQLTKCNLLAVKLQQELQRYEATRPLTDYEKASVRCAWEKFDSAKPKPN